LIVGQHLGLGHLFGETLESLFDSAEFVFHIRRRPAEADPDSSVARLSEIAR
jgi:hypothetical protein